MDEWGHVNISRKFFEEDAFWNEVRPRTKAEAWIDCIQLASWKARRYSIGLATEELQRGEFQASVRFLAKRWRWGKHVVEKFLEVAKKGGRLVVQREGQGGTVYLLVNYERYQGADENGGHPRGQAAGHLGDTSGTKQKQDKQDKKEKTGLPTVPHPLDPDVEAVIAHYRSRHPKRLRGDVPSKTASLIRKALKSYSVAELQQAIDNNAASQFHREGNHMGLELILRDVDHIDRFIGMQGGRIATGGLTDEPAIEYLDG